MDNAATSPDPDVSRPRKYKAACVPCGASKVKCPGGGPPCQRCANTSRTEPCHYRPAARIGKPPGSKNKKTLDKMRQEEAEISRGDDVSGTSETQFTSPTSSYAPLFDLSQEFSQQSQAELANLNPYITNNNWDKLPWDSELSLPNTSVVDFSHLADFGTGGSDTVWSVESGASNSKVGSRPCASFVINRHTVAITRTPRTAIVKQRRQQYAARGY